MRSRAGSIAVAVILLVAAIASIAPALAADKVREAVDRGNRAFLAAYAAHDSAKLAALYAPNAAAFPPGAARAMAARPFARSGRATWMRVSRT
jgi:ketosteroid isomerase-like protein